MVSFLGIDLAWSMDTDEDSSGYCIIDGEGKILKMGLIGSDEEMLNLAEEYSVDFVGIDAPLKIPNENGSRPVEKELASRGRPAYPANRVFFNDHYGGIRGERLVEKFEDSGYPFVERVRDNSQGIIEVYPNPTVKALLGEIPQYKNVKKEDVRDGVKTIWNKLKEKNLPVKISFDSCGNHFSKSELDNLTGKELKGKGDILDSFFCAYVLLLDFNELSNVELIGNIEEGYILTLIDNNKRLTDFT